MVVHKLCRLGRGEPQRQFSTYKQTLLNKITTRGGGGDQKVLILRRHCLWTAPLFNYLFMIHKYILTSFLILICNIIDELFRYWSQFFSADLNLKRSTNITDQKWRSQILDLPRSLYLRLHRFLLKEIFQFQAMLISILMVRLLEDIRLPFRKY